VHLLLAMPLRQRSSLMQNEATENVAFNRTTTMDPLLVSLNRRLEGAASNNAIVKEAYCDIFKADLPTIDCRTYVMDYDAYVNVNEDDDSWTRDATCEDSICVFAADYSTVNCTVLGGRYLLEQITATCDVASMGSGASVACTCINMVRGFMDSNCPSVYGCLSENTADWTDDCQFCYMERACE
jgi:hypothetical protein